MRGRLKIRVLVQTVKRQLALVIVEKHRRGEVCLVLTGASLFAQCVAGQIRERPVVEHGDGHDIEMRARIDDNIGLSLSYPHKKTIKNSELAIINGTVLKNGVVAKECND